MTLRVKLSQKFLMAVQGMFQGYGAVLINSVFIPSLSHASIISYTVRTRIQ